MIISQSKKKLKLDMNEQLLEVAKLFGIPEVIKPVDALSREENVEFGPGENTGNQPESS